MSALWNYQADKVWRTDVDNNVQVQNISSLGGCDNLQGCDCS